MNINAIKASRDAPIWPNIRGDVDDLLAVLAPLEPYLHHDMPVETLADVVKTIRESHERAPFITEDWATERQDREYYQGLLAECLKVLAPLASIDPALRDLTSRLLFVVVDQDDDCEVCGESDDTHTFAELLACCGGVDGIIAKADGALEMLRMEVPE
jgi:hypothetical protein